MAETTSSTIFVIKNKDGQFLEYNPFNGLRNWSREFNDSCAFSTQGEATMYCRSLLADAENHGHGFEVDVFRYDNKVTDLDIVIPEASRKSYGLPDVPATQ